MGVLPEHVRAELRAQSRWTGIALCVVAGSMSLGLVFVDPVIAPTEAAAARATHLLAAAGCLVVALLLCWRRTGARFPSVLMVVGALTCQAAMCWLLVRTEQTSFYRMLVALALCTLGVVLLEEIRHVVHAVLGTATLWALAAATAPTARTGAELLLDALFIASGASLALLFSSSRWRHTVAQAQARAALELEQRRSADLLRELEALTEQDPLTGAGNRRRWDAALAAACHRAGVSGEPVAVVLVDVDHFKAVNDEHGHAGGDAALVAIGELLRSGVRDGDVVARLGGDEFAVLLPGATTHRAAELAEDVRAGAQALHVPGFPALRLTLSLGVAAAAAPDPELLYRAADRQLYLAKEHRNRVAA